MDIGKKIQAIRNGHGMTQAEFADKFHVARQTVSNWENNKNYPDLGTLRQISDEYGVSFDILLKEDQEYISRIDKTSDQAVKAVKGIKILIPLVIILLIAAIAATREVCDRKLVMPSTRVFRQILPESLHQ